MQAPSSSIPSLRSPIAVLVVPNNAETTTTGYVGPVSWELGLFFLVPIFMPQSTDFSALSAGREGAPAEAFAHSQPTRHSWPPTCPPSPRPPRPRRRRRLLNPPKVSSKRKRLTGVAKAQSDVDTIVQRSSPSRARRSGPYSEGIRPVPIGSQGLPVMRYERGTRHELKDTRSKECFKRVQRT